eukprot:TRINITY_DN26782_c0_g1_i1.p1 TRINITY_DN26782_c0_g1~~TRINITY_DN26782_c0_g1_i1.p1  ORF type:complete len:351 (+),score=82.06 TRINITY_DN26782_c0_g1_i1:25-1053(+)
MGNRFGKKKQEVAEEVYIDHNEYRFLLIGPKQSGKSTLYQQVSTCFGPPEDQVKLTRCSQFIFDGTCRLIDHLKQYQEDFKSDPDNVSPPALELQNDTQAAIVSFNLNYGHLRSQKVKLSEDHAKLIKTIWADPGVKLIVSQSPELFKELDYFLNKVEDFAQETYLPTEEDLVHLPELTVKETEFEIEHFKFHVLDFAGPETDRQHSIESTIAGRYHSAFICVYDVSEYADPNKMAECLEMLSGLTNPSIPVLLCLNKKDEFEKKYRDFPLQQDLFPDWKGGTSEEMLAHIIKKFETSWGRRDLYSFCVDSKDPSQVQSMFRGIRGIFFAYRCQLGGGPGTI